MSSISTFKKGETVACRYRDWWFKAKILKISSEGYHVHYMGWDRDWDEPVKREALRKYDAKLVSKSQQSYHEFVRKLDQSQNDQNQSDQTQNENEPEKNNTELERPIDWIEIKHEKLLRIRLTSRMMGYNILQTIKIGGCPLSQITNSNDANSSQQVDGITWQSLPKRTEDDNNIKCIFRNTLKDIIKVEENKEQDETVIACKKAFYIFRLFFNKLALGYLMFEDEWEQIAAVAKTKNIMISETAKPDRYLGAEHLIRFFARFEELMVALKPWSPNLKEIGILNQSSSLVIRHLQQNWSKYFEELGSVEDIIKD
ncbi:histone acetylase complex subunit MRG15-2 [Reticulomyxa filosa]|uniref:Histone acetylase complex subunit MRG15-2 n=1 Tax=Reticulomyxa filosa TaxID=46433 RepID=X6N8S8_RETFI|nr:histone acetylase complex subunit MRG15-2 [Reticulomyxa filosa]|eukprot:ETO22700.1 histone acetylase complex subunit MRG15-2 [Reticulomyxa filosa]